MIAPFTKRRRVTNINYGTLNLTREKIIIRKYKKTQRKGV